MTDRLWYEMNITFFQKKAGMVTRKCVIADKDQPDRLR